MIFQGHTFITKKVDVSTASSKARAVAATPSIGHTAAAFRVRRAPVCGSFLVIDLFCRIGGDGVVRLAAAAIIPAWITFRVSISIQFLFHQPPEKNLLPSVGSYLF